MAAQDEWRCPRWVETETTSSVFISKRYSMGFFECCHYCKAPKRYPGCHDKCSDYIEAKNRWEAIREAERKDKYETQGVSPAQARSIRRNQRRNRKQY